MDDYLSKSKITEEDLIKSASKELNEGNNILDKYMSNDQFVRAQ